MEHLPVKDQIELAKRVVMCKQTQCYYRNSKGKRIGPPNLIQSVCYKYSKTAKNLFFSDKYMAVLYLLFDKYGKQFLEE